MFNDCGYDIEFLGYNQIVGRNEKINEFEFAENNLIEIILVGKRNFEINIYNLYKEKND